jgi:eukaryotic-like serine/threonine-protein kinase
MRWGKTLDFRRYFYYYFVMKKSENRGKGGLFNAITTFSTSIWNKKRDAKTDLITIQRNKSQNLKRKNSSEPSRHDTYILDLLKSQMSDKYHFEKFLGRGGFAAVYKVMNLSLGRVEALKVLLEPQEERSNFATRFIQEAKVSASLDHPNIVRVYEFGQHEDIFWFTMQYIEGATLADVLKSKKTIDEVSAVRLTLPLLDALEYSHNRGVIHRDIKPGNIMLDAQGRPYLMDFGIAKSMGSLLKTQTGCFLGTPVYVSPEQAAGESIDCRSDIYAIGVTLYEMLTGEYPFPAADGVQSIIMRLTNDPIPLSQIRPDIDLEFETITMRALEKEPDKRPASASEMHSILYHFLENHHKQETIDTTSWSQQLLHGVPSISQDVQEEIPTFIGDVTIPINSPVDKPSTKHTRIVALFIVVLVSIIILVLYSTWQSSMKTGNQVQPESKTANSHKKSAHSNDSFKNKSFSGSKTESKMTEILERIPPTDKKKEVPAPQEKLNNPKSQTVKKMPVTKPKQSLGDRITVPRRPVKRPILLKSNQPNYSVQPDESCIGINVNLSLVIGENGRVKKVKVISENHSQKCIESVKAIKESVMKYIFSPALDIKGKPIEAIMAIAISI